MVGEQTDRLTGARTHRLPKGKIDRRETLEQAALREVLEETGLSARIVSPLGSVVSSKTSPAAVSLARLATGSFTP